MMYEQNRPLSYDQLYNHKTIEDIEEKKKELNEVQSNLNETKDSLSDQSMKDLRQFIRKQKTELEQLFAQSLDEEIETTRQRIETLKQSPLFLDITEQHEQIRFLRDSIELQVEKYRRQKAEYRLLRKSDISKTRDELVKTLAERTSEGSKFITLYGVSRFVTEDDIRTQFDRYGFIYDIVFKGNKKVIIEFDTQKAAEDSLQSSSTICEQIILGKIDDFESINEDSTFAKSTLSHFLDDSDDSFDSQQTDFNKINFDYNSLDSEYNEQSEDIQDFISKPSTIRRSSFSPKVCPSPISFRFDQNEIIKMNSKV